MHRTINLYYLFAVLTYFMIKVFTLAHIPLHALVRNYLADLLCMPIIFFTISAMICLIKRRFTPLPIWSIAMVTAYWAIYFEWIMPVRNEQFTADIWDVLMYIVGAVFFVYWRKRTVEKQKSRSSGI